MLLLKAAARSLAFSDAPDEAPLNAAIAHNKRQTAQLPEGVLCRLVNKRRGVRRPSARVLTFDGMP